MCFVIEQIIINILIIECFSYLFEGKNIQLIGPQDVVQNIKENTKQRK